MTAYSYTAPMGGPHHQDGPHHVHHLTSAQLKSIVAAALVAAAIGMRYTMMDGSSHPQSVKADQAVPISAQWTQDPNAAPPGIWVPSSGGPVGASSH